MYQKTILLFFIFLIFSDLSARDVANRNIFRHQRNSSTHDADVTFESVSSSSLIQSREKRAFPLLLSLAKHGFFTAISLFFDFAMREGSTTGATGIIKAGPKTISSSNKCTDSFELREAYEKMNDGMRKTSDFNYVCQKLNDYLKKENAAIKKHFWPMQIIPHYERRTGYEYETFGEIYTEFFTTKEVDFDELFCPSKKSSLEWWLKNKKHWSEDEAIQIQKLFVARMKKFLQKTEEIIKTINNFNGDCDSFDKNDDVEYDYEEYFYDADYDGSGYGSGFGYDGLF